MAVKARAELTLASVSDGKPGSNGVGIKSTAISYQAGASQTKPPTGSWSAEPPKLSTALPYLWTKTVITYTDGKTSTSYSVSSTLDGVEVGGRNYLRAGLYESRNLVSITYDGNSTFMIDNDNPLAGGCIIFTQEFEPGIYTLHTPDWARAMRYIYSAPVKGINGAGFVKNSVYSEYFGTENAGYLERTHFSPQIVEATTKFKIGVVLINGAEEAEPFTFGHIKLEKGNKATDWTPAPEDVQQDIDDAQNSANDANNKVDNITDTVTKTSAELKVLSDSISSLVTDAKGQSLMTQTGSGWTFNIGSIQSALNGAIGDIQDVKGDISGINDLANKTNELANDVAKKTAYINMTQDESGQPVMELGQQNGEFKLRITNTSMDFMQGSQKIAYLSNRQLYIQSSVVTDEMKIGATSGYIWKKRANGNMGLRYVSG